MSDVLRFTMSPDGSRVASVHDAAVNEAFELYGVPPVFLDGFETGDVSTWSGSSL